MKDFILTINYSLLNLDNILVVTTVLNPERSEPEYELTPIFAEILKLIIDIITKIFVIVDLQQKSRANFIKKDNK